jgi:hypothetical protein
MGIEIDLSDVHPNIRDWPRAATAGIRVYHFSPLYKLTRQRAIVIRNNERSEEIANSALPVILN